MYIKAKRSARRAAAGVSRRRTCTTKCGLPACHAFPPSIYPASQHGRSPGHIENPPTTKRSAGLSARPLLRDSTPRKFHIGLQYCAISSETLDSRKHTPQPARRLRYPAVVILKRETMHRFRPPRRQPRNRLAKSLSSTSGVQKQPGHADLWRGAQEQCHLRHRRGWRRAGRNDKAGSAWRIGSGRRAAIAGRGVSRAAKRA
jgi:hypothetical protein